MCDYFYKNKNKCDRKLYNDHRCLTHVNCIGYKKCDTEGCEAYTRSKTSFCRKHVISRCITVSKNICISCKCETISIKSLCSRCLNNKILYGITMGEVVLCHYINRLGDQCMKKTRDGTRCDIHMVSRSYKNCNYPNCYALTRSLTTLCVDHRTVFIHNIYNDNELINSV